MAESDDDMIFDRNDGLDHNEVTMQSQQLIDLRRVINEMPMKGFAPEVVQARRRVCNKFLDVASIQDDINQLNPESIIENTDLIDQDVLTVGNIYGDQIIIDIPPITMTLNLHNAIRSALDRNKLDFIRLLLKNNINVFSLEPRIMTLIADNHHKDADVVLSEMINLKIPIDTDDYSFVYKLAAHGKLELLRLILKNYRFPNITIIVYKICIQAMLNNHMHLLRYFLPRSAFIGAPDQMAGLFLSCIQHGCHLDVIKFFIENGINLRQNNYQAVYHAVNYNQTDIIRYFSEIEPSVCTILTPVQMTEINPLRADMIPQYIENAVDKIDYSDILEGDEYYQCSEGLHNFKASNWNEFCKNNSTWFCPCCYSPVKRILYTNRQLTDC